MKHHLEQCIFSVTHDFLLRRRILKNGSSTVFGRLAQTYTMLMQPLTYVKARQLLTWYGGLSREESTGTCLQPFWWNTKRVLWLMEHKDWRPWKEHKEGVGKGWITVPPKAIQLWCSLGVYHISLCLHKVCTQPVRPKEKSVYHDIPTSLQS